MALTLSPIRADFGDVQGIGRTIGSAGAMAKRRGMLTDLLGPLTDPMATSADLAAVSKGLLSVDPKMAMQVAGTARQAATKEEEERRRPKTRADYFRAKPEELAGLYEKFTSDSIEVFVGGSGPLQPLAEDAKDPLSSYGKQLTDAGFVPGSAEFLSAMKSYNDAVVTGKVKGIAYKGSLEQMKFLEDALRESPHRQQFNSIVEKVNRLGAIEQDINDGKSEAVRLLERTASELFNSDTRAASEISRLTEGKGFARTFADAISEFSGKSVTPETKQNLLDIVKAIKGVAVFYNETGVDSIINAYGSDVDESVKKRFKENNSKPPFYRASDSKDGPQMPALPPGATLDSDNPFN